MLPHSYCNVVTLPTPCEKGTNANKALAGNNADGKFWRQAINFKTCPC
jgi:hypothetical protein